MAHTSADVSMRITKTFCLESAFSSMGLFIVNSYNPEVRNSACKKRCNLNTADIFRIEYAIKALQTNNLVLLSGIRYCRQRPK